MALSGRVPEGYFSDLGGVNLFTVSANIAISGLERFVNVPVEKASRYFFIEFFKHGFWN